MKWLQWKIHRCQDSEHVGVSSHTRVFERVSRGCSRGWRARPENVCACCIAASLPSPSLSVRWCETRLPPPSNTHSHSPSYLSSFLYLAIAVLHCSQVHPPRICVGGGCDCANGWSGHSRRLTFAGERGATKRTRCSRGAYRVARGPSSRVTCPGALFIFSFSSIPDLFPISLSLVVYRCLIDHY